MFKKYLRQGGYRDEAGNEGGSGGTSDAAVVAAEKATADAAAAATVEAATAAAAATAGKPTDAEAKLLKENMQKKAALQTANDALAAAQLKLKDFEGVDPAAIRKMMADQKAAEEAQLVAVGDFDRLKARMVEEHTKSTSAMQDQITALQKQLGAAASVVDELSIGALFAQSGFIKDETTLPPSKSRALFGSHFDLVDGKVVGFDKPRGEASRTAIVDQYGNAIGFDDAMRKIIEADSDKDHLLKSKLKPGSGSNTTIKTNVTTNLNVATDGLSKINAGLKTANLFAKDQF